LLRNAPPNLETPALDHAQKQMMIVQKEKVLFLFGDEKITAEAGGTCAFSRTAGADDAR